MARSYLTVTKDLTQVMNRLKAVYRSWAIPCAGKLVYTPRHRAEWLQKLPEAGVRRRAERWADLFRVDPGNLYVHRLLARFSILDDRTLKKLSVGTFFSAALLLTEGTGLLLGKRWAQYFTIFATSSFIPLEVYELSKRVSFAKVIVLLPNTAVVAYLLIGLRRNRKNR